MAREYVKTAWENTPSTSTPINADNLNHIEEGIYNLETKVEDNASAVSEELQGATTIEGNPITLSDSAPVNAVDVSVDLEPIQDLHGYDHPWVGGAGKNKLDSSYLVGFNESGLNVVNNNGVLSITGNVSSAFNKRLATGVPIKAGTYIISKGSSNVYPQFLVSYNNQYIAYVGATEQTITIQTDGVINIDMYTNSGNYSDTFYPMIRLSTETDSTFEPYTNICPISGRTEENIVRVGKNLTLIEQGALDGNGLNVDVASYLRSQNYIRVEEGQNLTFNATSKISGKTIEYILCYYDKNDYTTARIGYTSWKDVNTYNTIPSGANYARILMRFKNDSSLTLSNIENPQLELGTTATEYEPYKGKTYTIQLGQEVYGGRLDVTRGKLVVDVFKRILTTSDSSRKAVLQTCDVFVFDNCVSEQNKYAYTGTLISDSFIKHTGEDIIAGQFYFSTLRTPAVCFETNRFATNDDFRTWLSSNPIEVCYQLATPIEIDLTPTQIKMLENTNTLYTDYESDTITLEYQPNNAIGEAVMAVEESYDAIIQNLIDRVTALENQ